MERCPVCRAHFTDPVCRRCGTDFSKSLRIAEEAGEHARQALRLCRQGHLETAISLVQKSLLLKREPQLERLLDVLIHMQLQKSFHYLVQGKTQEASHLCQAIIKIKPVPLAQALHRFIAHI